MAFVVIAIHIILITVDSKTIIRAYKDIRGSRKLSFINEIDSTFEMERSGGSILPGTQINIEIFEMIPNSKSELYYISFDTKPEAEK